MNPSDLNKLNERKAIVLDTEDTKIYGNRCPAGYKKHKLLGK